MSTSDTRSSEGPAAPRAEDYSHLSQRGQGLVSAFRGKVIARIEAAGPTRLLEVGCGQGWLLASIADALPEAEITGIDVREDAVQCARKLVPNADLLVANGEDLPFDDDAFDIVVCSEVLEHVENPGRVLDEIDRVGSGHAILSVPHEPLFWGANLVRGKYLSTLGNCPGHIHHWSRGSFKRLLAGRYDTVEVETSFPWLIAEVRK